jgi:hypothetical protein
MKLDPFATETVALYVPVTAGERTVAELCFRPPVFKDLLAAGRYPEGSIPFTGALISSLTGEPEIIINQLVPEDYAKAVVLADRSYQRFCGRIDLFRQKDESENPTMPGKVTPSPTSSATSGA